MNKSLKGKVFVVGPDQASRFDDTIKAQLDYVSSKCDHRVRPCIQRRDKTVGARLLTKPKAPTKVDPSNSTKTVLDKDGEEWVIYQLKLKKYIERMTKLDGGL